MEDDFLGALGVRARGTEEVERAVLAEAARKAGQDDAEGQEPATAREARSLHRDAPRATSLVRGKPSGGPNKMT